MRKPDGQTLFLGLAIVGSLALVGYVVFISTTGDAAAPRKPLKLEDIPFNGERSYALLKEICDLGPRISGSEAMTKQQQLLTKHFEALGARVSRQEFATRHPRTGARVALCNLIVEWKPDAKERILLCTHYDTRPIPDQDPDRRKHQEGLFVGANDGASGAALLGELGQEMAKLNCKYGVDFVFFDAEELVYDRATDPYFLGSEHFAKQYVAEPPAYRYKLAVLVDMIGDASLEIFQEKTSYSWRDSRPMVDEIWGTAKTLGVTEFISRVRHDVRDDHLALHDIAKIPACDVIDFDYPRPGARSYWHTTADTPENCSALSLAKVGWVLKEWLERTKL
jgi:hypothetical protein